MGVLLTIAYDGSGYCGWQFQENGTAVQEVLEQALSKILGRKMKVTGASRTDAGVHALGQKAFFPGESIVPLDKIPYAVNSILPPDIRVTDAQHKEDSFHPQYAARNKTYRYQIYNAPFQNPMLRNQAWHVYSPLDIGKMKEGARAMVGEYDFRAFCASGGSAKTTVRTIYAIDLYKNGDLVYFDINGSGFLYNMVRIIAGTLVYCGSGRIDPRDMKEIILSCDRTKAGITAPPQGLTLMTVHYD